MCSAVVLTTQLMVHNNESTGAQTKLTHGEERQTLKLDNIKNQTKYDHCDMKHRHMEHRKTCKMVNIYTSQGLNVPSIISEQISASHDGCNLEKVEHNCKEIRESFLYLKNSNQTEKHNFSLAFALKIHRNANQAFRLLRYIYSPTHIYCIHVDAKAPTKIFHSFKRIQKCFDNIKVVDEPVSVVYSSIRQVEAEIKCMQLLRASGGQWKYYINLTGQEFMLKTNEELIKYLQSLDGRNDIESNEFPPEYQKRFRRVHKIGKESVYITNLQKQPLHINIDLRKGSAYGMFSREFVDFVLDHVVVKVFMKWLQDTYAPEEIIWATLNALSSAPGGDKGTRTYANGKYLSRHVVWKLDRKSRCYGKYVRYICVYGERDLPGLLASTYMVANKFYEEFEPVALTCLESHMYDRLEVG